MFYYKPWGDGFSVVTATFTVELGPGIFKLFIISYICFILWIHDEKGQENKLFT
jgi:hypothetical protein